MATRLPKKPGCKARARFGGCACRFLCGLAFAILLPTVAMPASGQDNPAVAADLTGSALFPGGRPPPSAVDLVGRDKAIQALTPAVLPADVAIVPPVPGIDADEAAFVGIWHGAWGGTLDTYVAVTEVRGRSADIFYAWGTNLLVSEGGSAQVTGRISNGRLLLEFQVGVVAIFRIFEKDLVMLGSFLDSSTGRISHGVFVKRPNPIREDVGRTN